MNVPAKTKGQRELAFSQHNKSMRITAQSTVRQADSRVNCIQHLLILLDSRTLADRFIADTHCERAREPGALLGHAHYIAIGRPFETLTRDGLVAWCEPPLPKRTARRNCLGNLIERFRQEAQQ